MLWLNPTSASSALLTFPVTPHGIGTKHTLLLTVMVRRFKTQTLMIVRKVLLLSFQGRKIRAREGKNHLEKSSNKRSIREKREKRC